MKSTLILFLLLPEVVFSQLALRLESGVSSEVIFNGRLSANWKPGFVIGFAEDFAISEDFQLSPSFQYSRHAFKGYRNTYLEGDVQRATGTASQTFSAWLDARLLPLHTEHLQLGISFGLGWTREQFGTIQVLLLYHGDLQPMRTITYAIQDGLTYTLSTFAAISVVNQFGLTASLRYLAFPNTHVVLMPTIGVRWSSAK
jgi:hypothetical protein